jgi:hypothetical protein
VKKGTWIFVLVILALLAVMAYGGKKILDETVVVPKNGNVYNYELLDPETNEKIDDIQLRYTGSAVDAESSEDASWVSSVQRSNKLWVNDDYHCILHWTRDTNDSVFIKVELREGPAMMFRLLNND